MNHKIALKIFIFILCLLTGEVFLYAEGKTSPLQVSTGAHIVLAKYPEMAPSYNKAYPTSLFALNQSTPTRIFTPNGDGINDQFSLRFNNPDGDIISQKKIFDLQGNEVADLQVTGDETQDPVTLFWNGQDKNGAKVRSGIYIYQVQAGGKLINGTVVLAR